jgi:ribosomal protein L29
MVMSMDERIKSEKWQKVRRIMGMTIEELVAENDMLKRQLAYESTALTMMQADYKARLKADLVAMLTEMQLEIEEVKTQSGFDEAWDGAVKQCSEIIQQKINALKGDV